MQTKQSNMANGTGTIESQQSGLSVVEQSCIGDNGGTGVQGSKSGGGLFSEVQTEGV
jgi:hypothetical protein